MVSDSIIIIVARIFFEGGNFSKHFKKFLKKIAKKALFYHIKVWENFRKFSKNFLRKSRKKYYFSIFSKNLTNYALVFCAFGRKKNKWFEIMRKFSKVFIRKLQKCIILAYFSNKLTNYALIFCAFGRKTKIVGKFCENFQIFLMKIL